MRAREEAVSRSGMFPAATPRPLLAAISARHSENGPVDAALAAAAASLAQSVGFCLAPFDLTRRNFGSEMLLGWRTSVNLETGS